MFVLFVMQHGSCIYVLKLRMTLKVPLIPAQEFKPKFTNFSSSNGENVAKRMANVGLHFLIWCCIFYYGKIDC